MEDLNKNQIILLTLLISFVTSIATGIMTVSLLQEAPLEVTRNINRIVEKTIETVTTPSITTPGQKEVTTVVVKEEDMIISSIDKNIKSIVRINEKDAILGTTGFYGIGLIVNKDGFIAADRKTITSGNAYTAKMSDGVELTLTPQGIDKQTNVILFKAVQPEKTTGNTIPNIYIFIPAVFSSTEPKLGQTLIGIGGETINAVSVGRVTSLDMKESGTGTSTVKYLVNINTDLSTSNLTDGSPVFNLSGDVVGVKLSLDASKSFTPVSVLKKEIVTLTEVPKTQ
ncbi:MAG: S1C family serine protease [Candidatus Zambryskibacteria bacterium]|nr:S1C family serine protease [Candidatus Zambryskibacteria bacterium]